LSSYGSQGSVTLSAAVDLDALSSNSTNTSHHSFSLPVGGRAWFSYQYTGGVGALDEYWFYPVICSAVAPSDFSSFFYAYANYLANISVSPSLPGSCSNFASIFK
jgi:hypothetical protein